MKSRNAKQPECEGDAPVDGATLNVIMKQANIKFTYDDYVQLPDDRRLSRIF